MLPCRPSLKPQPQPECVQVPRPTPQLLAATACLPGLAIEIASALRASNRCLPPPSSAPVGATIAGVMTAGATTTIAVAAVDAMSGHATEERSLSHYGSQTPAAWLFVAFDEFGCGIVQMCAPLLAQLSWP